MESYVKNNELILCPEGNITSVNAISLEKEILFAVNAHPGLPVSIDAEKLTYISSAGLRVLMKINRGMDPPLTIRNASKEVYEIFEVTGFTTLLNVRRKPRELTLTGEEELIGSGAFGDVYRLDEDTVVKVYRDPDCLPLIESEQHLARQAFLRGFPTAIPFDIVRVGDRYGAVFELIRAENLNARLTEDPSILEDLIREYAEFLRALHAVEIRPGELPDVRARFLAYVDDVSSALPPALANRLRGLLEAMPEDLHALHGDVQLKNVMYSDGSMILIDMDKVGFGNPVFEFAGLFACYIAFNEDDPEDSMKFFGLSKEVCSRFYHQTLACYFRNDARLPEVEDQIRVVGYLRYLYVMIVEHAGFPGDRSPFIRRVVNCLEELLTGVDHLSI